MCEHLAMYRGRDPREFGELGCGLAGLGLSVCNEAHVYEWCKRAAAEGGCECGGGAVSAACHRRHH